eukprot:COSAG05_NODE_15451_length_369_cov_0.829630_1_plen_84_part_01
MPITRIGGRPTPAAVAEPVAAELDALTRMSSQQEMLAVIDETDFAEAVELCAELSPRLAGDGLAAVECGDLFRMRQLLRHRYCG